MATFQDAQGRSWELALDAPTIDTIRDEIDQDFLKGDPLQTCKRLGEDPALICHLVYVLCRRQMAERAISQEDFYRAVIGPSIDAAGEALEEAMLGFIPGRRRELMEVTARKSRLVEREGMKRVLSRVNNPRLEEALVEKIEAQLDEEFRELIGETIRSSSATATPDSSESAPTD